MSEIIGLHSRTILDSRGNPTVEVDCYLESGVMGRAAVPSGASTGEFEAVELRDGGEAWCGKGVEQALAHVQSEIAEAVVGLDASDQEDVDRTLVELDGTANRSRLGANAILGVSMAVCRAAADESGLPLYRYLGGPTASRLPIPLLNVINGGAHANNNLEFQEFMLAPRGAPDFPTGLRWGVEVYHRLKRLLHDSGKSIAVGDEGGFAPDLESDEFALELLTRAVEAAGYRVGEDFAFALDVAASEFHRDGRYHFSSPARALDAEAMTNHYARLAARFPITSIEDGLDQSDWAGWKVLTERLGTDLRLVGDDLYVTNREFLARGIRDRAGNAILIKLNQIGTVSETLHTVRMAQEAGFRVIISHRSGETEDSFIADLAVATGSGWIKTGAPCRSDRNAKYNRLLRIHEEIAEIATYGPLNS
ncbi:MAG: phosphopyruvate hydratase [Planctomycetota bacterium]